MQVVLELGLLVLMAPMAVWHRVRIRLYEGKTRIWNSAGEEPTGIADLGTGDGTEPVWVL